MQRKISIANLLLIVAPLLTFTPSPAHAVKILYSSKNSVAPEINGTYGAGSMRSALGAGMMGARGFGTTYIIPQNPVQLEQTLLGLCQQNSGVTSWPEGCNPKGVAVALSKTFKKEPPNNLAYQNWVVNLEADQTKAINLLIAGLRDWKSPAVIPMYGVPDHWGTIEQMYVDVLGLNSNVLIYAKFYDAGSAVVDPYETEGLEGEVGFDYTFNGYDDMPLTKNGSFFKTLYYKMFLDPNDPGLIPWQDKIAPGDPYRNYHIMLREPPVNGVSVEPPKSLVLYAGTPLLAEDETLTPQLARELVFDALDIEGLLGEPEYASIAARGIAGDGWEVRGTMPSGEAQHYFVVPIHDSESGGLLGLVTLAPDGRFQMARPLARPRRVAFQTLASAGALARASLTRGETLRGGALRWSPTCPDRNCNAPDLPYFEFSAVAPGARNRRIFVPLVNGSRVVRY